MKKTNLPKRALSCMLACALACTMIPSAAFASDSSTQRSDPAAEEQPAPQPASDQDAPQVPDASDLNVQSKEVPIAVGNGAADQPASDAAAASDQASAGASASGEAAVAKEDLGIITTQVALDQASAPATLFASNGLSFQVNADDPATVTLVGWAGSAPAGALVIPSDVTYGDASYAVTNIGTNANLGGGVRAF